MSNSNENYRIHERVGFLEQRAHTHEHRLIQLEQTPPRVTGLETVVATLQADHHGHAGQRFVECLINDGMTAEQLAEALEAVAKQFPAHSSQSARAADRFALAALAGELAIGYGLLACQRRDAVTLLAALYDEWNRQHGDGHSEDRAILAALSEFLSRHGDSLFSSLTSTEAVRDRAGYWRDMPNGRVWLFTPEGLGRAVPGFDRARVVATLNAAGLIAEHDQDRLTRKTSIQGQKMNLYHINGEGLT